MQTVLVGYGKVNFPKRSMTLAAFVAETGFTRTLVSKRFPKTGRTTVAPVSEFPDVEGNLYSDNVPVPEGTVICLQGSSRVNGLPVADAAVFIRVREDAAGLLIQAKLPQGGFHRFHVMFSAHGDILDKDELEAAGVFVPDGYRRGYMNNDEISEVFTIREISPAKTAAPRLEAYTTPSGEEIKLNIIKPSRRMRIKR